MGRKTSYHFQDYTSDTQLSSINMRNNWERVVSGVQERSRNGSVYKIKPNAGSGTVSGVSDRMSRNGRTGINKLIT